MSSYFFQSNGIKTPFGEVSRQYSDCPSTPSDEKRSQFSRKVFINHLQHWMHPFNMFIFLVKVRSGVFKLVTSFWTQWCSKRSITSLSLFNNSKKDDQENQNNINKDRKNSFGRLRAARSSLDLSSLGFGSISRASSKATLTDLKEENDNINNTNKESV